MSLVRHYVFDDNAASTTLVATVGTNGALTGGDNTSAKASTGPGGTITASLDLNGTDDGLGIQSIGIDTSLAFTYSLWFYADSLTNLVLFGRAASSFRYCRITSSTNLRITTNLADYDFTIPTISTGTWYHVFITRTSGNSLRCWINGTESVTGAISGGGTSTTDVVGRSSGTYANARFAQFRVWDSDETANVATWYAEGTGGGGGGGNAVGIVGGGVGSGSAFVIGA